MEKFKLNSDEKVIEYNRSLAYPGLSREDYKHQTLCLTPEDSQKLERLRAKYKLSRSTIIRILLDSVAE